MALAPRAKRDSLEVVVSSVVQLRGLGEKGSKAVAVANSSGSIASVITLGLLQHLCPACGTLSAPLVAAAVLP